MQAVDEAKEMFGLFKQALSDWNKSNTARLGASLAYYTIFAIAPLMILAVAVAGFFFGEETARKELFGQINSLVGQKGGQAMQTLMAAANHPKTSLWASAGAVVTLGMGATAVFVELQDAMNTIWKVQRKAGSGFRHFVKDRLLSFAMVLGVGFLLLVSLVLNTVLSGVGKLTIGTHPELHALWGVVNFGGSLAVITLLFAMMYKILPDVEIRWQDVWIGAFVTALLFNLGKFLIGFYLGRSSMVSIYGAAGSFIILLLWVYYSSQILFFGAEFTRVYAAKHNKSADRSRDHKHAGVGRAVAVKG